MLHAWFGQYVSAGIAILYNCKLSSDQRCLLFDCHESVSSSPAVTPTADSNNIVAADAETGQQSDSWMKTPDGTHIIRPIELSKVIDVETHNADKQGNTYLGAYQI